MFWSEFSLRPKSSMIQRSEGIRWLSRIRTEFNLIHIWCWFQIIWAQTENVRFWDHPRACWRWRWNRRFGIKEDYGWNHLIWWHLNCLTSGGCYVQIRETTRRRTDLVHPPPNQQNQQNQQNSPSPPTASRSLLAQQEPFRPLEEIKMAKGQNVPRTKTAAVYENLQLCLGSLRLARLPDWLLAVMWPSSNGNLFPMRSHRSSSCCFPALVHLTLGTQPFLDSCVFVLIVAAAWKVRDAPWWRLCAAPCWCASCVCVCARVRKWGRVTLLDGGGINGWNHLSEVLDVLGRGGREEAGRRLGRRPGGRLGRRPGGGSGGGREEARAEWQPHTGHDGLSTQGKSTVFLRGRGELQPRRGELQPRRGSSAPAEVSLRLWSWKRWRSRTCVFLWAASHNQLLLSLRRTGAAAAGPETSGNRQMLWADRCCGSGACCGTSGCDGFWFLVSRPGPDDDDDDDDDGGGGHEA